MLGGSVNSNRNDSILRGPSFVIRLSTLAVAPLIDHPLLLAVIPMMVSMQVARAVPMRSVGENCSPRPALSTGASVLKLAEDDLWVASQCSSPVYLHNTVDMDSENVASSN